MKKVSKFACADECTRGHFIENRESETAIKKKLDNMLLNDLYNKVTLLFKVKDKIWAEFVLKGEKFVEFVLRCWKIKVVQNC